ncbi:MAG TPA: DUF177 domain-containing protein [Burkholderiaceae bacterium]|nr:DUF177 domain-containing protein [Burkholderiaceae bacterium]
MQPREQFTTVWRARGEYDRAHGEARIDRCDSECSQPRGNLAMNPSEASCRIDTFELARRGGVVEGRIPFAAAPRLRASLRSDAGAIGFRLQGMMDDQGRPAARLRLEADLPLACDRCGQPMSVSLRHEATFYFVHDEAELAALPVAAEDEEEPLLGSDSFDLAALVEDETVLGIPVSPRHAECPEPRDRRGSTARNERAGPFAGLRGLLRRDEH